MGYIGNAPFGGQITGDNVLDGSIKAEDLAPGAAVPTQTGQSGKYLTTDGTTASWGPVSQVPDLTAHNGKYLTTDGVTATWGVVSQVPAQTSQNGKYLTTDGSTASWGTVSQVPSQTGQTGKYLTTDGTTASWSTVATGVRVTGITYSGNDLATSPNGGQTVTLAGSGFASTPTVFVDGTIAPSVSFVSSSQITFVTPAKSAGTYHVYVVNPDGSTAIFVNGISYSGVPTWTTAAGSLGTYTGTFSIQLVATGDAPITYTLATGSSLPAGVALSSSGLISGTLGTEQTFSFSVDAVDAQNQETPRSFSVTVVLSDPYFEYNALLLSGNGANGSQNNTFLDGSTNNFTITRNGNTTQGTFSPFSQTGWGNYFDGTGDYLTLASNAAFGFGTGDFTVEAWVYINTATSYANIIAGPSGGTTWYMEYSSTRGFYFYDGATALSGNSSVATNQWVHLAVARSGTSLKMFVNGTVTATYTNSQSVPQIAPAIGAYNDGTYLVNGYISNLRLVKGTAVYTANFTPPTTPLTAITNTSLLTCQSNRFVDNSSNAFAITRNGDVSVQAFSPFNPTAAWSAATYGGSGYFDGAGDNLTVGSSFSFDTGTFTVEFWYYPTKSPDQWDTLFGSSGNNGIFFACRSGFLDWTNNNDNAVLIRSNWPTLFQWSHIALVQDSGSRSVFINGVRTGTAAIYGWQAGTINLGNESSGYFSGWRVVMGQAIYSPSSTTITVPTAPPTAITNTALLCNFTNAGIYDATSKNDLETVGNAQISTTQSKFGGSSMYFDGTSDALYIPANPDLAFGTGDFTVECWIYTSEATADTFYRRIYMTDGPTGNVSGNFQIALVPSSGYINLWDGTLDLVGTSNVCNGAWHHIAATRSGTILRLFVDGVQQASTTYSVSVSPNSGKPRPYIGTYNGSSGDFNGYIQDLRVTKGYARYTANFTPPTAAFKLR